MLIYGLNLEEKMEVLIVGTNKYLLKDINEFFSINDYNPHYATNSREAISILNKLPIDLVVFDFLQFEEFKLIKYINENHKDLQVIVTVNKKIKEILSIIKNSEYQMIQEPFRLNELKCFLKKESTMIKEDRITGFTGKEKKSCRSR